MNTAYCEEIFKVRCTCNVHLWFIFHLFHRFW